MRKIHLKKSKALQYADDVINGKVIVGEYIRLAVERFFNDLDSDRFIFDQPVAERVILFFETCLFHWKGEFAGKPMILEPHQHFYLSNLYGWKTQNGLRRFKTSYKEVGRKNGKSSECAGKALFHISKEGEEGAQSWVGANKEAQAIIVVNDAGRFVLASKYLLHLLS